MSTKQFNKRMMAAIFSSGLACLAVGQARAGVIIHNEGFVDVNDPLPNHPNYGSNIAASDANIDAVAGIHGIVGAPNIALLWESVLPGDTGNGWETYDNWDGRGSKIQLDGVLAQQPVLNQPFTIKFTPSGGAGVRLDGFILDAWKDGGNITVDWSVVGSSSGLLANGTWTKDNNGGFDNIAVGVNGALGEQLTLTFIQTTGAPRYLALDDLAFDQIVPEPASAALIAAGVGAMAMRRRRVA